ncbi:MAG TPA: hypothetical protein VGM81_10465 [Burkholderiaceae bacterium]|jgi:hypothetical protein
MKIKNITLAAVGAAALVLGTAPEGQLGFAQAQAQADVVRPEVGKVLKELQAMIKAGRYKEALGKLREAEAVPGRNANENYMIENFRVAAASGAGDADQMVRGYEAMKASGRLSGAQGLQIQESIAGTYLRNNDNAKALSWAQRYFQEGGTSPTMKTVLSNAQFKSGDMSAVLKEATEAVNADERAGRAPSKDKLNLMLYAAQKKGDNNAESNAVEKLLNYYPSRELWAQVLGGIQAKKGFSSRFGLDVLRLKLVTGNMRDANDYMDFAQLSAAAGYPEEGKVVVEKGMAAGILGQGTEGARHKRLLDLMNKKIGENKAAEAAALAAANESRDGSGLVHLGLAEAFRGQAAAGVKLIQEGIAKDQLAHPDDAKLYLGLAQFLAGSVSQAQSTWRSVRTNDGASDLAHLWIVQSRSSK